MGMNVQVRKLEAGEELAFLRSVMVPFLEPLGDDSESEKIRTSEAADLELPRAWVVEDGGRFVANCCTYSMDVTVPGPGGGDCPAVRMAGVSAVGVHPTHRRRGLLRQMMAEMLVDARLRGEPVAGLIASESIIYGRFGFGHATDWTTLEIDTRASGFRDVAPGLDLQLVDKTEAARLLPPVFEQSRRRRAGEPNRTGSRWENILEDRPHRRGGGKAAFSAVADGGYVRYRFHEPNRIAVEELRAVTPEIEASLWRYVLDVDLIRRVTALRRPVDEPLRWRLADPRQLQVKSVEDRLYLRVLDVPAALQARSYRCSGRLVIDLVAPLVEEKSDPAVGTWVLEAEAGGVLCRRAGRGEDPDLRMEITELGSLYMGGFKASTLRAAGRIDELTAGSVDVADSLFGCPLAPLSGTGF